MTQGHLFIMHFIPINIASAPSQIIRHQLPEVWDPWFKPPGLYFVVVFRLLSHFWLHDPTDCGTPGFPVLTVSWNSLTLMFTVSVMLSNHLILCRPLLLLLSMFLSIRDFPVSQFFVSGGQSIGASASASASVLPMNTQGISWVYNPNFL